MNSFKLIVAGSRDITSRAYVEAELLTEIKLAQDGGYQLEIVSGLARGPDTLGKTIGHDHGLKIHEFPADWNRYGKSAGYKRNAQMAEFADRLLAFWDGESRGTKHMIDLMRRQSKPVRIVRR